MRSANDLLCPRHLAAATDDQHTALLKLPRDIGGIETIASTTPRLGINQNTIRLRIPVAVNLIDMNETIVETTHEFALDLLRGAHDFTCGVEVAALRHPSPHARDDAGIGLLIGPGQQLRRDGHSQGSGKKRASARPWRARAHWRAPFPAGRRTRSRVDP